AVYSHSFDRTLINANHAAGISRVQRPELPGTELALRSGVEHGSDAGLPQRIVDALRGGQQHWNTSAGCEAGSLDLRSHAAGANLAAVPGCNLFQVFAGTHLRNEL